MRRPRPRRRSLLAALDAALFVFAGVSALWLAYLVLVESLRPSWQLFLLVPFWLLVAYLVLPRLHRTLTYLYLPNYFIGRTRTSDGRLGDAVNLALLGQEAQLHGALAAAGWTLADELSTASSTRIVTSTLRRRSYPQAPVSSLTLFGRRQDFAYQQEVEGNPAQRHHVRFWRCPPGWMLPGGFPVEWLAAGSFDRSVGLTMMTLQVTHRIAKDIDTERDHIVATVTGASPDARVHTIRNFSTGYHARNGGGDQMVTDGDLPVLDLTRLPAPADAPVRSAARPAGRPASTTFSAAVAAVRGLVGLALAVLLLVDPTTVSTRIGGPRLSSTLAEETATGLILVAVLDVGLGIAVFLGHDWARLLLMLSCAATTVGAYVVATRGGPLPTLSTGLPHVALGILVLLALTSPASRRYAERAHPPRPAG